MSDEHTGEALTPEEVRTVDFYGDAIAGALVRIESEAEVYIPLRPMCDFLGLSWAGQRERTLRDEVLAAMVRGVRVTRTPGKGGGSQEMLCLPLKVLPGWLFGIDTHRIKPELRERLILYRRECYDRLWDAFKTSILPTVAPTVPAPLSGAALAYELATAVQNIAREQMELEARMGKAAQWARGIESRVTALELRLEGDEPINETQAADISLAVKAVAYALEQRGEKNTYQRVYGELYRQYGVSSYKNLPRIRFDTVMRWLKDWHQELSAE